MTGAVPLAALGLAELRELDELLGRANHDVAKYMAMTARNVDPATVSAEELDYVRDDLLQTDGSNPAWQLWGAFSRQLAKQVRSAELEATDRAMAALAELVAPWPETGSARVAAVIEATLVAAEGITQLRRTVRRRLIEVQK